MDKKIKIVLPKLNIDPIEVERKIRAMFYDDLEKGGSLAKVFIFCYLNQPCAVTELTKKLTDYYQFDYDRATVFRAMKRLNEKYILAKATSGDMLSLQDQERKPIHKEAIEKYYGFLRPIPEQFRKNFHSINYFWVQNGNGLKYIEWCCKILNFKIEK